MSVRTVGGQERGFSPSASFAPRLWEECQEVVFGRRDSVALVVQGLEVCCSLIGLQEKGHVRVSGNSQQHCPFPPLPPCEANGRAREFLWGNTACLVAENRPSRMVVVVISTSHLSSTQDLGDLRRRVGNEVRAAGPRGRVSDPGHNNTGVRSFKASVPYGGAQYLLASMRGYTDPTV